MGTLVNIPEVAIEPFGVIGYPGPLSEESPHRVRYQFLVANIRWWYGHYDKPLSKENRDRLVDFAVMQGASVAGVIDAAHRQIESIHQLGFALDGWFYVVDL
jgi:hypothetical protein